MKNRNIMNILTRILFWLACVALSPIAQAVVPAPDGGYPGGNTAEGQAALLSLTTGGFNTAVGFLSLRSTGTGSYNTAVGAGTLLANTGEENTATGVAALLSNTTGVDNTANGTLALLSNTEGAQNTANGDSALFANTTGSFNTASGFNALAHNIDGSNNTADGHAALFNNTSGSNNVAVGRLAGSNLDTGNNNIDIGYNVPGIAGESNTIRIGNNDITDAFIRGISGATASGGAAVFVNSNGKLGTMTSSARFKEKITPMGKCSEAILSLEPVTFHYRKELDPKAIPQFGLVAEQVEKVDPDLVVRDEQGAPYSVRYEAINSMLLNEFLKEHRKVQNLEAIVAQLTAQLEKHAAQIEKVSMQLQLNKSVVQTVSGNQSNVR